MLVLCGAAIAFLALPLVGLIWKVQWSSLPSIFGDAQVREALWLSLVSSVLACAASVVFGVPLAWLLARYDFRGSGVVRALCTLPMVLPPVVGGVALLFALGRNGLVGRYLDEWFGLRLPYSMAATVIAQTFVAMPFLVMTAETAFRRCDMVSEAVAATLGASRWSTFVRVTLPQARHGLFAGAAIAWGRALGEFGATVTFAGNFPGKTQTIPLAVYIELERRPERAVALSLVLVAVSFAVLIGLRGYWLEGVVRWQRSLRDIDIDIDSEQEAVR